MSRAAASDPASAQRRLKKRYREEGRFRAYGLGAILIAIAALVVLLVSIVGQSISAFTKHELSVELALDPAVVDPLGKRDPEQLRTNVAAFSDLVRAELRQRFPSTADNRVLRRQLGRLVSSLAPRDLAEDVADDPALLGTTIRTRLPVADTIDLYLKGLITPETVTRPTVPATVTVSGDAISIDAPGAFVAARDVVVARVRDEAAALTATGESAMESRQRLELRLAEIDGERNRLRSADRETLVADALAFVESDEDASGLAKLARAAGSVASGGDAAALRAALSDTLRRETAEARKEADELGRRGERFAGKAAIAAERGEPAAETRRIQAAVAMLAAERRSVDGALLDQLAAGVPTTGSDELVGTAMLLAGRPLAPFTLLAAAETERERLVAARAINASEIAAARAALGDQQRRLEGIEAAVKALETRAPERAEALGAQAVPAAKSRLARLQRELEGRESSGVALAVLAGERSPAPALAADPATQLPGAATPPGASAASPGAPPAEPAPPVSGAPVSGAPAQPPGSLPAASAPPEAAPVAPARPVAPVVEPGFLDTETQAQIGLDYGGALGVAFALGAIDAQSPDAETGLRALLLAHRDSEAAAVQADIERLTRKAEKQNAAANAMLSRAQDPVATIDLGILEPSVLVEINGGVVKASRISPDRIEGAAIIPIGAGGASAGGWTVRALHVAEADRLVTDSQAAWVNNLMDQGAIRRVANLDLITRSDSTYPELAGLAAAIFGSFWIMLVTLLVSLPLGVMAAMYLEAFAPKNRITDLIEVNINNLAAVPSIVFGLLGAAVFINWFGLPRSAPVVGGLVLSLITLPTIIIATRASLAAVPPSIRDGALAVGASLPQAVFHHVLPLAAPGILTGAIIGLARALGETAPLLLIGMVAFVAEPPASMFDSATALPVLVYKWASSAERAWQPMTSAAIIVLLIFMFAMNALAVYLRHRLERRW